MKICLQDGRYYIIDTLSGVLLTVKSSRRAARKYIRLRG